MATETRTGEGIVLLLSCAAQFMVVLDIAMVNVALPSIQQDFGIGQSTLHVSTANRKPLPLCFPKHRELGLAAGTHITMRESRV